MQVMEMANWNVTHLIAEDLNLAGRPVDEAIGPRAEVVSVYLQVKWLAFDTLLGREIGAEGVDADVNLREWKKRVGNEFDILVLCVRQ